jgi:molybdate transport repressor ModE-like protein
MPTDIDLRLLRYFIGVADERSFTAAALELGISQPALSQAVRRLEALAGGPLIRRDNRGPAGGRFALTTAGAALYDDARDLLQRAEGAFARAVRAATDPSRIRVNVGFGSSAPREVTGRVVRVGQDLAEVEVVLEHVPWGEERERLLRGTVDVLVVQMPRADSVPEWEVAVLGERPRIAVFAADHPLAGRAAVELAELGAEPIVDAGSDRDFWLALPRPGGAEPPVVGPPARNVEEMLALVSAGRGMAITSAAVADNNGNAGLAFVPISDLAPVTLVLAWQRGDHRAAVAEVIERVLAEG